MYSQHKSETLFSRGRKVIPDGVSSPMRAFALVGKNPICIASAHGSRITDVDGNEYTDFLNGFGTLILGHGPEKIVSAITQQAAKGTIFGLSTEVEYALAEKLVASTPAIEKIRFVCSGTEAVMTAVRIARCETGRNLLVKFNGSYHGHSDVLLASPVNLDRTATKNKGVTKGITAELNREVLLCEYNDRERLSEIFSEHGADIAAVVVEPYATNMGFVKSQPEFLRFIEKCCREHGALLIFDEVVTGFRINYGGACNSLGIDPDLVTFGKIIGGGAAIGAFAGKARYMDRVAIGNEVFQSGTFSANPLTMAAGNAALEILSQPGFYDGLEAKGAFLESKIKSAFAAKGIPFHFSRVGSLCGIAMRRDSTPMRSYKDVKTQDYELFRNLHSRMLEAGFLMPPSLEEPLFLSAAHSEDDLARFAEALSGNIVSLLAERQAAELQPA